MNMGARRGALVPLNKAMRKYSKKRPKRVDLKILFTSTSKMKIITDGKKKVAGVEKKCNKVTLLVLQSLKVFACTAPYPIGPNFTFNKKEMIDTTNKI